MNYEIIDTQKIIGYITPFYDAVSVDDIIQNPGADKLRMYPVLFELEQNGFLKVMERGELRAPLVVRRRRDTSQVQYDIM